MASVLPRGDKFQVKIRRKGIAPMSATFPTEEDATAWGKQMEALMAATLKSSPNNLALVPLLQDKLELDAASVICLALRELADKHGIVLPGA